MRGVAGDGEFLSRLQQDIDDHRPAKVLFTMRSVAGKTQGEMARLIGRSQGYVSTLETSTVDRIGASDLVVYARALDLRLSIWFGRKMKAIEAIKHHAYEIRRILDHLIEIAGDDPGPRARAGHPESTVGPKSRA